MNVHLRHRDGLSPLNESPSEKEGKWRGFSSTGSVTFPQ